MVKVIAKKPKILAVNSTLKIKRELT